MFVDASALVAMLTDETKARVLASRLQRAATRLTAPPAVVEAIAHVAAATNLPPERTGALVARFLDLTGIRTVSLPAQLTGAAAQAMERFGANGARQGGLSPNECLAYAAARYYRVALLHDNAAFAATDIEAG